MSPRRIAVFGDGPHELGRDLGKDLDATDLPPLPCLVHRITGEPADVTYARRLFRKVPRAHGRGQKYAKKALQAIRQAASEGFDGVTLVIDRDRREDRRTIIPLREGRDAVAAEGGPPCAVGQAVETFDAWMIADGKAIAAAGGDASRSHLTPESPDKAEGTGGHPKQWAADLFRGGGDLGGRYAIVARKVDLDLLEKRCPSGFAPFAREVRERIGPVVSPT